VDLSSTPTLKSKLMLPALLAAGALCGVSLGITLSNVIDTAAGTGWISAPAPVNTATKNTTKKSKSSTVLAAAVDRTEDYLLASQGVTPESKLHLGLLNNTKLRRPHWAWSREEFTTKHAPVSRVFGAALRAPEPVAKKPRTLQRDRLVVALDPGHGGTDPGSEAHNGLIEKELTLDMAKRVELFLSEIDNVEVVMTRSTDRGMSRQKRVDRIKAVNADVVVSLHFNHLPQTDVNLVESFYADRHNVIESLQKQNRSPSAVNLDFTEASGELAHIMHEKVYNEVASVNEQVINAGVKQDTLFVLTRSFTPGVLLELSCISNPAEAERLATDEYRNQLAASIADGLRDYLLEQHGDQFTELLAKLDS